MCKAPTQWAQLLNFCPNRMCHCQIVMVHTFTLRYVCEGDPKLFNGHWLPIGFVARPNWVCLLEGGVVGPIFCLLTKIKNCGCTQMWSYVPTWKNTSLRIYKLPQELVNSLNSKLQTQGVKDSTLVNSNLKHLQRWSICDPAQ